MPIVYVEQQPVVAIDGEGVGIISKSGSQTFRFRCGRAFWRKFLETEMRRLNEWEIVERAERGRILAFKKDCNGH